MSKNINYALWKYGSKSNLLLYLKLLNYWSNFLNHYQHEKILYVKRRPHFSAGPDEIIHDLLVDGNMRKTKTQRWAQILTPRARPKPQFMGLN